MNQFASVFAQDLWRASWQGGLFILAVFAVCKLFRRLPAAARYWLWWLACLQLPVRLLFFSPVSLPFLPAGAATQAELLAPVVLVSEQDRGVLPPLVSEPARGGQPPLVSEPARLDRPPLAVATILMLGWGVGGATVLVLATRRLIRTRRLLSRSQPLAGEVEELAGELSFRLGVKPPRLRESESAPCPLLAGWLRPTIVLPTGFCEEHHRADVQMALAHELSHLKRRDLWLAGVPMLTQALFFFHPLAWLAIRESAAACEEACDIEAMRLSGGSASAYARLLLSSAQSEAPIAAMGAAFGFRLLHRRINMLSQSPLLTNPGVRKGVTALIALGIVFSIPWQVTAQTPPTAAVHAVKKKAAHPAKHRATKHHLAKAKAKAKARPAIALNNVPPSPAVRYGVAVAPAAPFPQPTGATLFGTVAPPARPGAPVGRGLVGVPAPTGINPPPAQNPFGASSARSPAPNVAPRAGYGSTTPAMPLPTGGTVIKPPMPLSGSGGVGMPSQLRQPDVDPPRISNNGSGLVSVDVHYGSLISTIRSMFKAAHESFSIKSTVENDYITCSLENQTLDAALQTLLQSCRQELTFRLERGVYFIEPKNPTPAGLGGGR